MKPTANKSLAFCVLLSAFCLLLGSCALLDDNMNSVIKATLDGNPISTSITFSNEQGDKKTIDILCTMPWIVSQKPDWLQVIPPEGDGSGTITILIIIPNGNEFPFFGEIIFLAANGDKLILKVSQNGDIYFVFKSDATPRWESGALMEKNHESSYTFVTDAGGKLTSSSNYKTGRITTRDGNTFEMIEFDGPPAKGVIPGAILRTAQGATPLHHFEIVKEENSKLWMIFKESASSPERRVVQ